MDFRPRTNAQSTLRAAIALLVGSFVAFSTPAVSAQSGARDQLLRTELPGATLVTAEALEALDARISPAVFRLRTTADLGQNFRPRYVHADGVATWVQLVPEEPPVLITSFAHVAQADSVEIEIQAQWYSAQVHNGTVMFDLATLQVDEAPPLDPASALPLATSWPYGATIFSPALTDDAAAHLRSADNPDVVMGSLGPPPGEPFQYYTRATFSGHNGFPIVSIDGQVLAISSLPARDRIGGALVIPFSYISAWREEWGQLRAESPLGWVPRVRHEEIELEAGSEALR